MASSDYRFVSHWRVPGAPEKAFEILEQPLLLTQWWPAVYLAIEELEPGIFAVHSKGRLPYTLRWKFKRTLSEKPRRMELEAWGDLTGRGVWTLEQAGGETAIQYDWRVSADKPLLRNLSFILKPVFAANHRWAMARGEEGLRAEILRRGAPV